jgi:hypothetical protein
MAVIERLRCKACDAVYERQLTEDGNPVSDWRQTSEGRGGSCSNCTQSGRAA